MIQRVMAAGVLVASVSMGAWACSSDNGDGTLTGSSGFVATGGATPAPGTGGVTGSTGGALPGSTGGAATTGGAPAPTAGVATATGGADQVPGGSDAGAGGSGGETPAPMGTCLQGTGDFSEAGPYAVETTRVTIGSSGQFTIYVPSPLEDDCHPMVAWGNGTTVSGGTAYRHFNERMASWGIVTIASHDDGTANSGPRIGDGSFHTAAIDYLLEENENPASMFFGKLNGRAGVSGHSQGGAGGDRASSHPNVEANGNVQGSFGGAPAGVAFLCLTGTEDIATESCLDAVNSATSPAMYASFDGMSHVATLSSRSAGSQQYARLLSGWFRCFLADDTAACAMFQGGADCPICQESGWDNIFASNF